MVVMYEIFNWPQYSRLFLALSVPLRIELSMYINVYLYFAVYLAFRCPYFHNAVFYYLFNQPS